MIPVLLIFAGLSLGTIGCGARSDLATSDEKPEETKDTPNKVCPPGLDTTHCIVTDENVATNDSFTFGSLPRKVTFFNHNNPASRMCQDYISFKPDRTYNIKLTEPLAFTYTNDGNEEIERCTQHYDPFNFLLDGAGAMVNIDATNLDPRLCAIELYNSGAVLKNITVLVHNKENAICDFGRNNSYSEVEIISDEP